MFNSYFGRHILPFAVATLGEFAALYYWLIYHDQHRFLLANVLLWTGFLVERVAVLLWKHYVFDASDPTAPKEKESVPLGVIVLLAATLTEIVIWVIWLLIADRQNPWLAAGFFLVFMQVQHAVEMAALRRRPLFSYFGNGVTLLYTLAEVVGAAAWLAFVRAGHPGWGAGCLFAGLFIEHVIQGRSLKPEPLPTPVPATP